MEGNTYALIFQRNIEDEQRKANFKLKIVCSSFSLEEASSHYRVGGFCSVYSC